jgi:hypothetical protein
MLAVHGQRAHCDLFDPDQGVTKRCRLSWLTNSALVYEPKCGAEGGGGGSQPISTALPREPKKNLDIKNQKKYMI